MEKEALEFLKNEFNAAADMSVIKKDDQLFLVSQDDVRPYRPDNGASEPLRLHTLSSIVDYLKNNLERAGKNLLIQIDNPQSVSVKGALDGYGNRETLLIADAMTPDFYFGRFMDAERMNIELQSQFVKADDREILLKFLGNVTEDNSVNTQDDGVSQVTTVKTGVATVSNAIVPNPVRLKPYRTFVEVEQPSSDFIFRMQDGMQAALFEADGGQWRNEAIKNIKEYFDNELDDEVGNIKIKILA